MKKSRLIIAAICLIVLYAIAVVIFHVNYEYIDYMCEEYEILIPCTIIYVGIIILAAFIIRCMRNKGKDIAKVKSYVQSKRSKIKEGLPEASVTNLVKITRKKDPSPCGNEFRGTGVTGLTRLSRACKIIGCASAFIGISLACQSFGDGQHYLLLYGIYFIIGGICCLLNILFVNALVTITKAAKIYIDKNSNK